MGKVRRLVALIREKEFVLGLAATFAAILGVASAILSITGIQFQIGIALFVIAVAMVVAILFHFRGLASPQVAVDDVLFSDNLDSLLTHLHCPCDLSLSNEAKGLARQCYAASVTIGPDLYEQLRAKNPYILACLTDRRGKFLGYFDAIPIRESFGETFLRGAVTEMQITHEDVLPPDKMHHCKYLFIAGLAVHNPNTYAGRRHANILVWALLKYLAHFYGSAKPLSFAVAATKEGDHLLHRFGVNLQAEAANRVDGYRLYSLMLTREEIAKRLAYLPDWQLLCLLDWAKTSKSSKQRGSQLRPPLPLTKAWTFEESHTRRRSAMESRR
jgi:hypothetical protein